MRKTLLISALLVIALASAWWGQDGVPPLQVAAARPAMTPTPPIAARPRVMRSPQRLEAFLPSPIPDENNAAIPLGQACALMEPEPLKSLGFLDLDKPEDLAKRRAALASTLDDHPQ